MTAAEFWMLPDDGMRHELLAGRLTVMEPTGFEHGAWRGMSSVCCGSMCETGIWGSRRRLRLGL